MGTHLTSVLAALGSSTKMLEVVILAVVVILLGTILILYKRNSRPAKAGAGHAASTPTAASYYSDVGTLPAPGVMGGQGYGGPAQSDPFAGFGGGMEQNRYAAPPPPPPPAPAQPAMPPPGTPASWLPDPAGTPDTLRYWDGMSWTQHVARRN
ncbi:MAG TPA: DUF2510 domain-containing protein [Acidimicrobiales bacterium]|nr:DUF2510 domain-containing protein [Acidimicrobiales bacterium]